MQLCKNKGILLIVQGLNPSAHVCICAERGRKEGSFVNYFNNCPLNMRGVTRAWPEEPRRHHIFRMLTDFETG